MNTNQMNEKELRKPISIGIFTALFFFLLVPQAIAQDATPPTFSNDADDAGASVFEGTVVNVSVLWTDDVGLSYGIFRTNQTGTWQNVSNTSLTGASDWFNTTLNTTTNDGGEVICWNQYANDTSNNFNTSMSETAHCFQVKKQLNVTWADTSEVDSDNCLFYGMCPLVQNDTFGMDTNVTCVGPNCGNIFVETRYGNETLNMTLMDVEAGSKPFEVISGKFEQTWTMEVGGKVEALSNDANYLYIGSTDYNTYVYNKTDWSLEQTLTFATDWVLDLANDQNYLYITSRDANTYVVNKTDWSLAQTLSPLDAPGIEKMKSVDLDNDYVFIGYDKPTSIAVVNKTDWSLVIELTDPTNIVNSLSNDNNYLYAGSEDTNVYVYNKTDWSLNTTLTQSTTSVLAVENDANYIYAGTASADPGTPGSGKTLVYKKADWSLNQTLAFASDSITSLTDDDQFIYMGSLDLNTYVVNKGGNWTSEVNLSFVKEAAILSLDDDDEFVYNGKKNGLVHASRKNAWKPKTTVKYSDFAVKDISNDLDYMYIGSADNKTYVTDKNDWSSVANLSYATDAVNALTNDNLYLYIGSADNKVYVVNKADWSSVANLTFAGGAVNDLETDDTYLYIGSEDRNTYVVNKTDWSLAQTVQPANWQVKDLAEDSNYLYIGLRDSNVYVISKTDWTTEQTLTFATDWVLAVDDDDDYVFIGSRDDITYVVNKGTWTLETTITLATKDVLDLSNDRATLFIASDDNIVYYIDKGDWTEIGRSTLPDGPALSVDGDPARLFIGTDTPDFNTYVVSKEVANPLNLGFMEQNESLIVRWLIKAWGDLGTEWKIDNNFRSSSASNTSAEVAWVRITILTSFNFTVKNESMDVYENTNVTIYDWDGNQVASQTLTSSNPKLSTNLYYDFNYDILQSSPALDSTFTARFYDFIIELDSIFEPQLVENYTNNVPPRSEILSVYAINGSQILNVTNVTLTFPKAGKEITGIFHCTNWNFTYANCSSWELNHTSDYNIQENSTHIWFNVSSFTASYEAYGVGNQKPLPNITEIRIYDVTTASNKTHEGSLEDSGLNSSLTISHEGGDRIYRFELTIENEGTANWTIEGNDITFMDGLNENWTINVTDEIWYNVTTGQYAGGSFSNGNVSWNTSLGGNLSSARTGEIGYFNFIVNISAEEIGAALSIVDFPEIPHNTSVAQNHTFLMNATVKCDSTDCGDVNGTVRYNSSGTEPDTAISTTNGTKPLYILQNQNNKGCPTNPLSLNEQCELTWNANATGDLDTAWNLDVQFSSNESSSQNYTLHSKFNDTSAGSGSEDFSSLEVATAGTVDTENHLITITYPAIHIILDFDSIDFGTLDPGTENNSALGNGGMLYNISVPTYASTVEDLWVNGTDLAGPSGYSIPVENVSWSLTNDISTETALTGSYEHVANDLASGSVTTTYYWIDVPYGKLQGSYTGTIYFKANTTEGG